MDYIQAFSINDRQKLTTKALLPLNTEHFCLNTEHRTLLPLKPDTRNPLLPPD